MFPTIQTGLLGAQAAASRIGVLANNVANAQSTTFLQNGKVIPEPFQPVQIVQTALPEGGVRVSSRPVEPATKPLFDPNHPAADEEGVVEFPNVNVTDEMVNMIRADIAFKASLSLIRTGDEVSQAILDIEG